jgi:hypothetical protein
MKMMKMHPLVKRAVQLTGYKRQKRGYTGLLINPEENIDAGLSHKDPTDPFFQYQWYLVSYHHDPVAFSV